MIVDYVSANALIFRVFRSEPPRPRPPLLAEGESGQRREHARLPERHSPADPRAERGPGDNKAAAEPEPAAAPGHPERRQPDQQLRHVDIEVERELGLHTHQLHVRPPEPQPPPARPEQALHLRRHQLPEAEQPRPPQEPALERLSQPADLPPPDQELRPPAQLEPDGTFHTGTEG
jgi:hypothetical protein